MNLDFAFVIGPNDTQCARVGEVIHRATPLGPLLIWQGQRQLCETDLMCSVERRAKTEDPGCIAVVILAPFTVASDGAETTCRAPAPYVSHLLGFFQARLPASHLFVIRDEAVSDYWIDPAIHVTSLQDPNWRQFLGSGIRDIGVEVDFTGFGPQDGG